MIGFRDLEAGRIEYDLESKKITKFRDAIAYASQYPILFDGSVEENITLSSKSNIDQTLLFQTALKAGCFPKNILDSFSDFKNLSIDKEKMINSFLHKKVGMPTFLCRKEFIIFSLSIDKFLKSENESKIFFGKHPAFKAVWNNKV